MAKFDHGFLEEMKHMFNLELIGVASVTKSGSRDLKKYAHALLPGAKSVVVLGKEIFQEMVALLGTTQEVGEAFAGDYFVTHTEYINGRLTNAVHGMAGLLRDLDDSGHAHVGALVALDQAAALAGGVEAQVVSVVLDGSPVDGQGSGEGVGRDQQALAGHPQLGAFRAPDQLPVGGDTEANPVVAGE